MRRFILPALVASSSADFLYQQRQQQQLNNDYQKPLTTACELLAATFPGRVSSPGDLEYARRQATYWSQQQSELTPSCRFYPQGARDIQEALADILIPLKVNIAIESGGHSSVAGASNVHLGVTIDLSALSKVKIAEDGKSVYVGPGARWRDVYTKLEARNMTTSGGRVADVGVGGYVLGGGFSWFANQHGWTCDSVLQFEVVTPQAEILRTSRYRHEDLFWAVKGSLGAFGIITEMTLPIIPSTGVYGGTYSYSQEYLPRVFNALENLALEASNDVTTQGYLSFAWIEAQREFKYSTYLVNTEGISRNDALAMFDVIPHSGPGLRSMTIGESATEVGEGNPLGFRRTKFTLTSKANSAVMMALHEVIRTFSEGISFDEKGMLGVTFQPLTLSHIRAQNNMFNLNGKHGPLLLMSVEIWWKDTARDPYFNKTAKRLRHLMKSKLRRQDALNDWIYPNYAAADQNPFDSLPSITKQMLAATKRKYDPDDLWRRLVPGIWHI